MSGLVVLNYQDYNNKYLNGINNNLPGEYPEIMGNTSLSTINGSEYFSQRASVVGRATYGFRLPLFRRVQFPCRRLHTLRARTPLGLLPNRVGIVGNQQRELLP